MADTIKKAYVLNTDAGNVEGPYDIGSNVTISDTPRDKAPIVILNKNTDEGAELSSLDSIINDNGRLSGDIDADTAIKMSRNKTINLTGDTTGSVVTNFETDNINIATTTKTPDALVINNVDGLLEKDREKTEPEGVSLQVGLYRPIFNKEKEKEPKEFYSNDDGIRIYRPAIQDESGNITYPISRLVLGNAGDGKKTDLSGIYSMYNSKGQLTQIVPSDLDTDGCKLTLPHYNCMLGRPIFTISGNYNSDDLYVIHHIGGQTPTNYFLLPLFIPNGDSKEKDEIFYHYNRVTASVWDCNSNTLLINQGFSLNDFEEVWTGTTKKIESKVKGNKVTLTLVNWYSGNNEDTGANEDIIGKKIFLKVEVDSDILDHNFYISAEISKSFAPRIRKASDLKDYDWNSIL